jgi:transposase
MIKNQFHFLFLLQNQLGQWLVDEGCSHVAMESTGIYWKSVWNVLEAFDLDLLLANAHHVKNLPGRKTDMKDVEWIAKLLRCGLIEGSLFPLNTFAICAWAASMTRNTRLSARYWNWV